MKNKTPTALVILDGFGYRKETDHNAIAQAHTPHFDALLEKYPATLLAASGIAVGLPEGSAGNSEVGHLTIGSGSVVLQARTILHYTIQDKSFFRNKILVTNLAQLKKAKGTLHLIGLLSDRAVHSDIHHLFALLEAAKNQGITNVVIHPILDGVDVAAHSAHNYLEQVEQKLQELGIGKIGTLHGRFYAMDRNGRTELTQKSYDALTKKQSHSTLNWREALENHYKTYDSEEFLEPIQLDNKTVIKPRDGVIFFNFRADRARQLTTQLLATKKSGAPVIPLTFFITPVPYGEHYHTTALYQKPQITHTLSQMIHDRGYSLFSVAETEKQIYTSYFFNGGRTEKLIREKRVLVPSPITKNYATCPQMSADSITDAVVESLHNEPRDFYVINYANADMVGHTGDFNATVKAVESLDKQLGILYAQIVEKASGTLYITSDHGNVEDMFDEEKQKPKTESTTNPVFFIMAQKSLRNIQEQLPLEELSDIAPFVVHNLEEEL